MALKQAILVHARGRGAWLGREVWKVNSGGALTYRGHQRVLTGDILGMWSRRCRHMSFAVVYHIG